MSTTAVVHTKLSTSLASIAVIVLKEVRLEMQVQQFVIAERMKKTPGALAKIESGKNSISLENFLSFCDALNIGPAEVIKSVERYAIWLKKKKNWNVEINEVDDEDDLLKLADSYYKSEGFKQRRYMSMLSYHVLTLSFPVRSLNGGSLLITNLFRYITDDKFKAAMDKKEISGGWRDDLYYMDPEGKSSDEYVDDIFGENGEVLKSKYM